MAALENKAGKFVEPTIASGQAALAGRQAAREPDRLGARSRGRRSYPIVTYTWIICYKKYADAKKLTRSRTCCTYCLTDGQKRAEPLGYIPLPENVVEKVKAALGNIIVGSGEVTGIRTVGAWRHAGVAARPAAAT